MHKTLWKNAKLPNGQSVNLLTGGGRIIELGLSEYSAESIIDVDGNYILPGIIDPHVHVRDMKLSHKETWATASMAAAAGGVTTIFDMPNTIPPTIDEFGLMQKRKVAANSLVNWGVHFGATPDNFAEMRSANNFGGFKLFLARSSSAFPIPTEAETSAIFELGAELNKPVIVHSECQACIDEQERLYESHIHNHNVIRNPECAIKSTEMILRLCEEIGNTLYIAHVSTRRELDMIRRAKDRGINVLVEATPHHLLLDERILRQAGNFGKVNPPIRSKDDRDALWEALVDGTVDTIGTDHAPHMRSEKERDYSEAPSGFPGLETAVPLLLSQVNENRISIPKLVSMTSENPARIFGVKDRGELKKDMVADFAIVSFSEARQIDANKFYTSAKYSPFHNTSVSAAVKKTIINGELVFSEKIITDKRGQEVDCN